VKIGSVSSIHMHFDYATKAMTILVYTEHGEGQIDVVNIDQETTERLRGRVDMSL